MSTIPPPGPDVSTTRPSASPVYHGLLCLWLLGLVQACAWRGGKRRDPVGVALQKCELLLVQTPPGSEGLEQHLQCLLDADVAMPQQPRIHARLARALALRAWLDPLPEREDLATARSWAMRCLLLNESVAGRLSGSEGRLGARPLRAVTEDELGCLSWGGLAWSHWLWQQGALAASIDLAVVDALTTRALELATAEEQAQAWYARAVALAVVPAALDPDRQLAEEAFAEARSLAPERLSLQVDQAELLLAPAGDEEGWRAGLQAVLDHQARPLGYEAYEDLAAKRRAQRLLDAGMPEPSRWSGE